MLKSFPITFDQRLSPFTTLFDSLSLHISVAVTARISRLGLRDGPHYPPASLQRKAGFALISTPGVRHLVSLSGRRAATSRGNKSLSGIFTVRRLEQCLLALSGSVTLLLIRYGIRKRSGYSLVFSDNVRQVYFKYYIRRNRL